MSEASVSGEPRKRTGRSSGGSRIQALEILDRLVGKKKNQKAVIAALEAELHARPMWFFRKVIMPLLSREARLSDHRVGVIQWQPLVSVGPADYERGEVAP